jgi:hypothetical protein
VKSYLQRADTRESSHYVADPSTLRATGVVALLAIGTIHFLQIVPTFQATPLLGLAYLALIVASVIVAAWLVVANDARAWAAAGLISAAVLVGYAFTRLVGTTFDNQDVGNWACTLGLASIFVETALFGLSGAALALNKRTGHDRLSAVPPVLHHLNPSHQAEPGRVATTLRQLWDKAEATR